MTTQVEDTELAHRIRETAIVLMGGPRFQVDPSTGALVESPIPLDCIAAAIALSVLHKEYGKDQEGETV